MDKFNVQHLKKLQTSDNVKSEESIQNTPYIPAMHQEQKDSVSFSGGNKPASAKKASNACLSKIASSMSKLKDKIFACALNKKMTKLNKKVEASINKLEQSDINDYEGMQKNIDNFIKAYIESFESDSENAAEMVNDVVGKISSFLILKNNSKMIKQLLDGLFNNITNNATSDEGLKTLELTLKAFINLPPKNTNSDIEAWSNVLLKRLNLFNLINNQNSKIEDILNAGIDYIKYKHPQAIVDKTFKEFITILKDDEKKPLFIKVLYAKVCSPYYSIGDVSDAITNLIDKIETVDINNVSDIDYEFIFPSQQKKLSQDISAKIMNFEEGCALVKDLAEKSLKNDYIEPDKTLKQISKLPDSKVDKDVKQYALMCLQNETLVKEFKKGKGCNIDDVVDNALSLASSNESNYNQVLNQFIAFIQNNDKNDTNQQLNSNLIFNLCKKSKCCPPTNESTTALFLLKSLENQQNGVISESSKKQIKKFIALSNLYNVANNPDTKMEEIVNNMLETNALFKKLCYISLPSLFLEQAKNILTDVNKGNELIKILFEKAKDPQQRDDVIVFLSEIQDLDFKLLVRINENVAKTANNAYNAITTNQEKYEVSIPSIFSTPQTEEYNEDVEAKIATLEPIKGENGEHLKQTLYINGKAMEFMCYNEPQMRYAGSNGGYFVYNPDTHDLCWFKAGGKQSQVEAIASQLYSLAGVPVAEMQLCQIDSKNGKKDCVLSRYLFLDKVPQTDEEKKKLNQGFGMDVLLANWDAVISDNAQMSGEQAYRVDFGGTFNYRAQGGNDPNKFISIPDEITSMFEPQYDSCNMFDTMTREDLINSLESVCKINEHDMAVILQKNHLKMYKNTLIERKECLKEMLDIIKNKPKDDNVSMFDYLTNIKHEVIKNHIENASQASEITDLQKALDKITDDNVKQELQKALNVKKAEIVKKSQQQDTRKTIDEKILQELLTNSIYTKDSSGNYVIDTNNLEYKDYIQAIEQHYTNFGKQIETCLSTSINNVMLEDMLKMLNYDNGKFIGTFTKDIKSFVIFYNDVKKSIKGESEIKPEQWESLVNSFIHPANEEEMLFVMKYKQFAGDINKALTKQKKRGTSPSLDIQKTIDNLTSYIQTQKVPQNMVVYRGEGYDVLNSAGKVTVQFYDGSSTTKPLGYLLQEAATKNYPKEKRQELVNKLLDMNLVATQERFMSTSAGKSTSFDGNVEWELTVPAGSHALYAELANLFGGNHQEEIEFILQRDSQITITAITFENGKWKCQGTVYTP